MSGSWRGSTRKARLPKDWKQRRARVFAEYGRICHVCGEPGADEVDHVKRGDDHSLENLRPIHGWRTPQGCHKYKTARESAEVRQQKRERLIKRRLRPHPGLLPPPDQRS